MIRLSKLTDYGILLMTQMARRTERTLYTARGLAAETKIPLPTVSKILKLLAAGGLLASHRGVKGGYSLARLATEITVREIITVLEGPIGVTECGGAPGACEMEPHCPVSANWRVISGALRQALENVTISDLSFPQQMAARREALIAAASLSSATPASATSALDGDPLERPQL
jgi:FeS assembly SUF system regulator